MLRRLKKLALYENSRQAGTWTCVGSEKIE